MNHCVVYIVTNCHSIRSKQTMYIFNKKKTEIFHLETNEDRNVNNELI